MANTTVAVPMKFTGYGPSDFDSVLVETLASETSFYPGAMVGRDVTGYACKGDDAQSWFFDGFVAENRGIQVIPAGTAGDELRRLWIFRPRFAQIAISGVAVTDVGTTVYASDDQTCVLTPASLTYANPIGVVKKVVASGIALVECFYDGPAANVRLGAFRRMAATGAQSLTICDVGKTIGVANTAALALTIPAVSSVGFGRGFTIIKDHASDANAITVTCSGSDSIDGSATLATLDAAWDAVTIVACNTNRFVAVSRDIA